jgi:hypothetical protein
LDEVTHGADTKNVQPGERPLQCRQESGSRRTFRNSGSEMNTGLRLSFTLKNLRADVNRPRLSPEISPIVSTKGHRLHGIVGSEIDFIHIFCHVSLSFISLAFDTHLTSEKFSISWTRLIVHDGGY